MAIGSLRTGASARSRGPVTGFQVAADDARRHARCPSPRQSGFGVALSLMMQLNQEALDLRLVALVPDGAG